MSSIHLGDNSHTPSMIQSLVTWQKFQADTVVNVLIKPRLHHDLMKLFIIRYIRLEIFAIETIRNRVLRLWCLNQAFKNLFQTFEVKFETRV